MRSPILNGLSADYTKTRINKILKIKVVIQVLQYLEILYVYWWGINKQLKSIEKFNNIVELLYRIYLFLYVLYPRSAKIAWKFLYVGNSSSKILWRLMESIALKFRWSVLNLYFSSSLRSPFTLLSTYASILGSMSSPSLKINEDF